MRLRRALIESGREYKCEGCENPPTWQGKELRLQVDHINGRFLDNTPENLRFLCPNCHSQTSTFGYNKGMTDVSTSIRYSREMARRAAELRGPIKKVRVEVSDSLVAELKKLMDKNLTWREIGRRLGITDSGAKKRARRYGLIENKAL